MPTRPLRHRPPAFAVLALCAMLAGSPPLTAQTANEPRMIAYLGLGPSESVRVCMNQLRAALEKTGWSFDGPLVLEWNDAANDPARLAPMAEALVARRPAILLATENTAAEALMKATRELPIVMMGPTNLHHVLDAQARPLANVTGVSLGLSGQYLYKPVEVLLQAFPNARRIGMVENDGNPGHRKDRSLGPVPDMVRQVGAELFRVRFSGLAGIAGAWEELARLKVDAVVIWPDSSAMLGEHAQQSLRLGLPAIAHTSWFATRYGGLLSYGAIGRVNMCARGAHYVDRVLRGFPLAELPVEELFEAALVVNLDAAERLGVTLPHALIARADRVIRPKEATLPPRADTGNTR